MEGLGAPVLGVYCERGFDPEFWAEPVNAVSNAAFLIAGALIIARRSHDRGAALLGLVVLVIGVGSFLFHTFATRWALVADVGPIQIFIALYFYLAMRRLVGLGAASALAATVAFMAAAALLPQMFPPREPWRGLGGYLGGFLGLLGLGAWLAIAGGPSRAAGRKLLAVAALFGVSLGFRTLDGAVCATLSTGSHAVWHMLNAVVLYTLVATLSESRRDFDPIGR